MNMKNRIALSPFWFCSALFFALINVTALAQRNQSELMKALSPPQSIIDVGNEAPLIRYNRYLKGGGHTDGGGTGGWQVIHALAAWSGNASADDKLLKQIEYNLEGDNTITAKGGYPCQHELHMTGTYAILRQSPRFWKGKLTKQQRGKIDLIMTAALVASAYTTSDATYANGAKPTAIDGDTNLNRGWNPNYREGMIGAMLVSTIYFGGVDEVYKILNNFNHDHFVAQLKEANLTNIHETFTWHDTHPDAGAPSPQQIEKNIRDYRYNGKMLEQPMDVYYRLTKNTYGKKVNCGVNEGKGILVDGVPTGTIVQGCDNLPNKGEAGMLLEFDGVDAGGPRSSIVYAYDGFRPNLTNHLVVLVGGQWKLGSKADELLRLMDVGVTDLVYKLENGYRNYAKAHGSTHINDIQERNLQWSYRTTIPYWREVVRIYHLGE
jgi:hypothetical protein